MVHVAASRSWRVLFAAVGALALLAALVGAAPSAHAQEPGLQATVVDAEGAELGAVTFTPAGDGGTLIDADLAGLPPGFHGFHVHENGECDPDAEDGPFTTAGGHFAGDDEEHQDHAGDLPVLFVDADGSTRQQMLTHRFSPIDVGGRALIVHADPDSYANIPDRYSSSAEDAPASGPDAATLAHGDAGSRIACGAIAPAIVTPEELPAGEDSRTAVTVDDDGRVNGVINFTAVDGGVLVEADVSGLTEGFHGFHLHQGPTCTDESGALDFVAGASGHWNPGDAEHRDHAGDMPVLLAGDDGAAQLSFVTDRIPALDDLDDRAVIVHADPDNYANIAERYSSSAEGAPATGPDAATLATGDAGGRVACGIVDGTALRLAGGNRFETAIEISNAGFGDGLADAAVLARGDRFADGLAGTPLATTVDGPLLLTEPDTLTDVTATELERVLSEDGIVYLLGGEAALSTEVEEAVTELGFATERIAGDTRIETALEVAEAIEGLRCPPTGCSEPLPLLITTGFLFPDALAAGAAAGNIGGALLLTVTEERHPAVDAYLEEREGAEVFAVGGPAARPYDEAEPVFGATRIETAVKVAETFFDEPVPVAVGVARQGGAGDDDDPSFADAMTGGAHIARLGSPILLTPAEALAAESLDHVADRAATTQLGFVYGGTAVLSPQVHADLQAALHP